MQSVGLVSIVKNISLYLKAKSRQKDKNNTHKRQAQPFLLIHLFESICQIKGTGFFIVLEVQELVSAMTSHIYENI